MLAGRTSGFVFGAASLVLLQACALLPLLLSDDEEKNGEATQGVPTTPASADASTDGPAHVGAGCGTDPTTGSTLCLVTSLCPELVVDHEGMPGCGFRIRGASVDLVCVCGTDICPVGVFATCEEATRLLASQTQPLVCAQVNEGRCVPGAGSGVDASAPSDPLEGCEECYAACGGGDGCAQLCNCR